MIKWLHIQDSGWWERCMKYAVRMCSVVLSHIPSLVNNGSSIEKLLMVDIRYTGRKEIVYAYFSEVG
jgi:hypothetical protein